MALSEVFNIDCMEGMKGYPDKYFDLAIVDPPYGIGADNLNMGTYQDGQKLKNGWTKKPIKYKKGNWDNVQPNGDYFDELTRVSKNQIIWGGNHFNIGPSGGYIVWDKLIPFDFSLSMCELAWTNCTKNIKKFTYQWCGFVQGANGNIRESRMHPTQKPIALYKWLLKNYAKPGDKILDTHLGSQSSRIAAYDMGFDFWGYEIDKDYFEAGNKRFEQFKSQLKIF